MLLPLLGLAFQFALESTMFLSGRSILSIAVPDEPLMLMNLLGTLFGAWLNRHALDSGRVRERSLNALAALLGGGLVAASRAFPEESSLLYLAASFCLGIPMALLLRQFFRNIPAKRQGLSLGLSQAMGALGIIFMLIPGYDSENAAVLLFVLAASGIFLSVLLSPEGKNPAQESRGLPAENSESPRPGKMVQGLQNTLKGSQNQASVQGLPAPVGQPLLRLGLLMTLFFILSGALVVHFFQYDTAGATPVYVLLYAWIGYLLIGVYLDRRGGSQTFFVICFALSILTPIITIASESDSAYFMLFCANITGKAGALFFLQIRFAQLAQYSRYGALLLCLPYVTMYTGYLLAYAFFEWFHPGTAGITLVLFFLCCTFNYFLGLAKDALNMLSVKDQLPTAVPCPPAPAPAPQVSPEEHLKLFGERYGLSHRENEVLANLIQGQTPDEISRAFSVSLATIKTHISQILRKTESANRILLLVKYYTEPMGFPDETPKEQPASLPEDEKPESDDSSPGGCRNA